MMKRETFFWFTFILAFSFYVWEVNARKIEHLVVQEKIDRVGDLQNGGEGEVQQATTEQ